MAEKVRVVTTVKSRFGRTVIMGKDPVTFDHEGIAEVSDKQAKDIFALGVDVYPEGKVPKQDAKVVEKKVTETDSVKITSLEKEVTELKIENATLKSEVERLTGIVQSLEQPLTQGESGTEEEEKNPFADVSLEEARELCQTTGYPKNKWGQMSEAKIREYLWEKLKEEEAAEQ